MTRAIHCFIGHGSDSTSSVTVEGVGSTWDNSENLYVGDDGNGTLNIMSGGAVSNTHGFIGHYSDSTSAATVDGAGTTWTNDGYLYVGSGGNGTLCITNGGAVSNNGIGYIGHGSHSTSVVTVDGDGSTWANGYLYVGYYGNGTLNITDDGAVSSTNGYIGYEYDSTGEVTVDSAGSTWTNDGNLYVGYYGNGTLGITNGSAVSVAGTTYVGRDNNSTGNIDFGTNGGTLSTKSLWASPVQLKGTGTINTQMLFSDVDLVFDASHGLSQTLTLNEPGQDITLNLDFSSTGGPICDVGTGYQGNGTLAIRDGISITSRYGYIGYKSGSNGTLMVDGIGSNLDNHGYLYVGYYGGGTLNITGGGTVSNNYAGNIGLEPGSTGTVTVDGGGSTWINGDTLYIGREGSGTLNIMSGATVSNEAGYIGDSSDSTGEVTVDGAGSTWTNSDVLYVGHEGSGTLNITGGGEVSNSSIGYIGYERGSTGAVTVDGIGSTWTNNSTLHVGYEGNGTLDVNDGGTVSSDVGHIGIKSSSTGEVTIDGAGSTWTISDRFFVGYEGSGTLNIRGGGVVSNGEGFIGGGKYANSSISTGEVTVDGVGSTWINSDDLYVGYNGSGMLNITGGGTVSNYDSLIGYISSSSGTVTVDGVGSIWTNHYLYVGDNGSGILNITGGGAVSDNYSIIGDGLGSTGAVMVDGAGSTWTTTYLYIGDGGSGTLNITDGGAASNTYGYIGHYYDSTSEVTVDGVGSTWTNRDTLHIGYFGNGTLSITNGSAVSVANSTYVSYDSNATGTIDFGTNGGTLTTGSLGASFTHLKGTGTINTRGLVSDVDLVFDASHGVSQTLTLNDPGQNITLNLDLSGASGPTGDLGAGYQGNGTLTIRDGIAVASRHSYLGYKSSSTGEATVNGVDSTWINQNLYVGYNGSGTLNITDGGLASNLVSYIGHSPGSTGEVMVVGTGSTWNNYGLLFVGHDGNGKLTISNGGLVRVGSRLDIDADNDGDGFVDMGEGGMLALMGEADDSIASFMDLIGGSDALRYWNDSTLLWENISAATAGSDYTLSYQTAGDLAGHTLLMVLTDIPLLGDANLDDSVDVSDLGALATNYGVISGMNWAMGDFNFDGAVDVGDLGILASNYGAVEVTSTTAVPEPTALSLLFPAIIGLLCQCRMSKSE